MGNSEYNTFTKSMPKSNRFLDSNFYKILMNFYNETNGKRDAREVRKLGSKDK